MMISPSRADNSIRFTCNDRLHESAEICRVVFKVGILNDHQIVLGWLVFQNDVEPRRQRRPFSLVHNMPVKRNIAAARLEFTNQ